MKTNILGLIWLLVLFTNTAYGQKHVRSNKTEYAAQWPAGPGVDSFITPEAFGANGTGDDYVAIEKAFEKAALTGKPLLLSKMYHIGGNTVKLSGSNISILGRNGGFIGTADVLVRNTDGVKNVRFDSVNFTSTGNDGSVYGLFTSENISVDGLFFVGCSFSAPNARTNGIKIIAQTAAIAEHIQITSCNFSNLGQMGIEFQNHNFDGQYRYSDISITNNTFANLGLRSDFGMAISFSGKGQRIMIDKNRITGAKDIGIELAIGLRDVTILENSINELLPGCAPFSFSNSINNWNHENITVAGNITSSDTRSNFYKMTYATFIGNTFKYTGENGYVRISDVSSSAFLGNRIITNSHYNLFIGNTGRQFSDSLIVAGNELDNSAAPGNAVAIWLEKAYVGGNLTAENTIHKAGSGTALKRDGVVGPGNQLKATSAPGYFKKIKVTDSSQLTEEDWKSTSLQIDGPLQRSITIIAPVGNMEKIMTIWNHTNHEIVLAGSKPEDEIIINENQVAEIKASKGRLQLVRHSFYPGQP